MRYELPAVHKNFVFLSEIERKKLAIKTVERERRANRHTCNAKPNDRVWKLLNPFREFRSAFRNSCLECLLPMEARNCHVLDLAHAHRHRTRASPNVAVLVGSAVGRSRKSGNSKDNHPAASIFRCDHSSHQQPWDGRLNSLCGALQPLRQVRASRDRGDIGGSGRLIAYLVHAKDQMTSRSVGQCHDFLE